MLRPNYRLVVSLLVTIMVHLSIHHCGPHYPMSSFVLLCRTYSRQSQETGCPCDPVTGMPAVCRGRSNFGL
ncbi:hypothetical protein BD309DRAFT_947866 [Dichomitus squalens]|nr:hypothetical protein BD309DRAFT_947866 [Dichomitus squalens]